MNCESCKSPLKQGKRYCSLSCYRKNFKAWNKGITYAEAKQCSNCPTKNKRVFLSKRIGQLVCDRCFNRYTKFKEFLTDEEVSKRRKGINLAENNGMWAGDNVGYGALHSWVKKRLPKPELCTKCKIKKAHDLANISQKYKRDLDDWEWLCRSCHMAKDGRLESFIKSNRGRH